MCLLTTHSPVRSERIDSLDRLIFADSRPPMHPVRQCIENCKFSSTRRVLYGPDGKDPEMNRL